MAEQVPAVGNFLTEVERGDWPRIEGLLQPFIHWTTAMEDHLHGPATVLDFLQRYPPPAPPAYHELDGGLLTRWIDSPG